MCGTADEYLDPSVRDAAAVINELVAVPWPTNDADRRSFFFDLGFVDAEPIKPEHESETSGRLIIPGLGSPKATWGALHEELFSINIFLYEAPRSGTTDAEIGYRAMRRELVSLFGGPMEEDSGTHGAAASFWTVDDTSIEMYCHVKYPSALQLGLSDTKRNKAYEALFAT